MTDSLTTRPTAAEGAQPPTEPCGTCSAPMADDQRYCLNCGTRRGEPRLDPLAHLTPSADRPPETTTVTTTRSRGAAMGAGLPILGALAVLAALGVGVLIGSSGEDAPVISQRPPVVNITSAAAGPADPAAASNETAVGTGASAGRTKRANAKESAADRKDAAKDAEDAVKKAGGAVLSKRELEATRKLSPDEARKRSAKLPAVVGTGGAPPPKDDKPAGAGTDAEVIK